MVRTPFFSWILFQVFYECVKLTRGSRYTKLHSDVKQYYEDNADIVKTLLKNEGEARGVKVMAGVVVAGLAGIALL